MQPKLCLFVFWPSEYLKILIGDGRKIGVWQNAHYLHGSGRRPLEVVSRNLAAGTEGDHQQHQNWRWLGSNSKTRYPRTLRNSVVATQTCRCSQVLQKPSANRRGVLKNILSTKLNYYSSVVYPNRWQWIKVVAISIFITTIFHAQLHTSDMHMWRQLIFTVYLTKPSPARKVSEYWNGKNVGIICHDLIWDIMLEFVSSLWGNPRKGWVKTVGP
jgi:hypothetical protein